MKRRYGIVSHVFPPTWSGQSRVLYLLLHSLPSDRYVLLSSIPDLGGRAAAEGHIGSLSGKRIEIPPYPAPRRSWLRRRFDGVLYRLGRRLAPTREALQWHARKIEEAARQESCQALVGCSGHALDLPATCLASRALGIPFFAYCFDYYSQQWTDAPHRNFALSHEANLLREAAGVIAPNEALAEELAARYGIQSTIIHNPCAEIPEGERPSPRSTMDGQIRIVYTGAVYEAQLDALRNVARAIQIIGRPEIKLHLYTARVPCEVGKGVMCHPHLSPADVRVIQQEADVLLLPLSFRTRYPAVIRTSAPGKMGEYLAAGRPILLHAPADSFLIRYFRKHECGVSVEEDDPRAVAEALQRLLADRDLQQRTVAAARRRARIDFDVNLAAARFEQLLSRKSPDAPSGEQSPSYA